MSYNEIDENSYYPPEGVECEVNPYNNLCGFSDVGFRKCTVIKYHGDFVWIDTYKTEGPVAARIDKVIFRPIKTEREKAIEAARDVVIASGEKSSLEALYDAGMLRLPEDKNGR